MFKKIKTFFFKKRIDAVNKAYQFFYDAEGLCQEVKEVKFTKKAPAFIAKVCAGLLVGLLPATSVFAAGSNTQSIDKFVDFACDWLFKIGGVVMLVGGVMFALGWQREDAEGKTRGLQTLMAGAMVAALGKAPDIFGL